MHIIEPFSEVVNECSSIRRLNMQKYFFRTKKPPKGGFIMSNERRKQQWFYRVRESDFGLPTF